MNIILFHGFNHNQVINFLKNHPNKIKHLNKSPCQKVMKKTLDIEAEGLETAVSDTSIPETPIPEAVIFDFDGVILDSFQSQFNWMKYICDLAGKEFPVASLDEFRDFYREPYPEMYTAVGFDWNSDKDMIWREFRRYKLQDEIPLVEGIEEVLQTLDSNRIRLAISSSNSQELIAKSLKEYGIEKYFQAVVAVEDLPLEEGQPRLKPYPDCITIALDRLSCRPENAVYIGDQASDIIAAKRVAEQRRNAVPVIAVSYGFSKKEKLLKHSPDYMVDDTKQLLDVLEII